MRSGQRDGSVERAVCGSKEVACEASRCAAAVSAAVGGGSVGIGEGGACACDRGGSAAADGGGDGPDTSGEVSEILIREERCERDLGWCKEDGVVRGGVSGVDGQ